MKKRENEEGEVQSGAAVSWLTARTQLLYDAKLKNKKKTLVDAESAFAMQSVSRGLLRATQLCDS